MSIARSRRRRLSVLVLAPLLAAGGGGQPSGPVDPQTELRREGADAWLTLTAENDGQRRSPPGTAPTIAIPVVRTLGVDVSRLPWPGPMRIHLSLSGGGHSMIRTQPGTGRYVFDVDADSLSSDRFGPVPFSGIAPYQSALLIVTPLSSDQRIWQGRVRSSPRREGQ